MALLVRRVRDKQFIKELDECPGYRRVAFTKDTANAMQFGPEDAARLCEFDFFGDPYVRTGYNGSIRQAEFDKLEIML